MTDGRRISTMTVAALRSTPLTRVEVDAMMSSSPFRSIGDLLPSAVIILDGDENIVFANLAAEKMSGLKREEIEHRPFDRFLQRSGLKIDEWLSAAAKGRSEDRVRSAHAGQDLLATRRRLPLQGDGGNYTLLTFQSLRRDPGQGSAHDREGRPALIFPPEIEVQITQAVRAYRRGVRVLLLGESGVGKTAIAKHIHAEATQDDPPFVHVNCGSIPETLFESEMFGYERGAFTGALQAGKRGFIESAAGGTLFLDEVGEIPYSSQAKLLKFLEDGTIQPVGSANQRKIATTVITATNRDLPSLVAEGAFRRDLYFRIATFPVTVPSLRHRPDVDQLLEMFLARVNASRSPQLRLTPRCRDSILASNFAGNIRELRSIIDYLDIVVDEVADVADLEPLAHNGSVLCSGVRSSTGPRDTPAAEVEATLLRERVQAFEQRVIDDAVASCGSQREAAILLGIDVSTLIRKRSRGDKA